MEQSASTVPKQTGLSIREDLRKNPKPDGLFKIDADSILDFFKRYYIFLRPIVNLTDREIDVIASFMKHRWLLYRRTPDIDPSTLDILIMTDEIKDEVIKESHLSKQHFYVVMSTLKKKGILKNNIIEPKIIPNVAVDNSGVFKLMIVFKGDWQ